MNMADRESARIQVGILTVSDSCFNGEAIDRSGESLKQLVESGKHISGTVVTKDILPDEYDQIKAKLLHWSDNLKLDLILTTGGTGFSLRDVTPEATKAVLDREALGMAVAMLKGSLEITPLAMLTRLACGTRGKTLIINLPGSTKGSAECFEIASKGIPHAVDLLRGHKQEVEKTHSALQSEGIRSAHGNSHHHQLPFPSTQTYLTETVPTNSDLPLSRAPPVASIYSLAATPHLMLNQTLSQPVMELGKPKTATATSITKPTKSFTLETPGSQSTTVAASTTLHFWKTLLSLSEAARMDLINLVPQTTSSQPTATSSVFLPLPGGTIPVMSTASTTNNPGSLLHGKRSLSVPASQTLKVSTNIGANTNSYANIQALPSATSSSAMQPQYADSTLHYLHTAPSVLPASAGLPRGHNVSLLHVPSHSRPLAASTLNSTTHIQPLLPRYNHPVGEPAEEKCPGLNNSEVNLPTEEVFGKSCSFTLMPVCADSTTSFSTSPRISPTITSSYTPAITCHDIVKNWHQHPTTCISKGFLPPTSVVLSSNNLSSLKDNLAIKYIDASQHSHDIKYITHNHTPMNTAGTPKVEILLENLSDSPHVCTRDMKPVVDCAGNPLVQILLPCSKHLQTEDIPSVQNKCPSAATKMKRSSLRSIVRKNRTRILNILKKQNKIRKACVKEVKISLSSRIEHASQLDAEADEDIDASLEIDIENEDTMNGSHHSLYLTNSEQLRDNSQFQDVGNDKEVELKAADNIITPGGHEMYDNDDVCLYTQPGGKLNNVTIVPHPAHQQQDRPHTSAWNSHLLYSDQERSVLPKDSDSQNNVEILPKLSYMSASGNCENGHTLPCPASAISLIAKWSTSPINGMMTIKTAKIHNVRQQGELFYVPVGKSFKEFIKEHPLIQGIYLHKGKREIKKQLAQLCRQCDVGDKMTTWRRGSEILERNCFDDYFELTDAGRKEQEEVLSSRKRDQYIVNWYVWCPGHGNCRRKCGGYGACARGCQGMQHKQDRHNCSLMVNMKLLLSDLSTWRVNITGTHTPCESGIMWSPPVSGCKQFNQSARNYHNVSEVTKYKQTFHPKKAAVANAGNTNRETVTLAASFTPDVWSITEASDESRVLTETCSASLKTEGNLRGIDDAASTSIPTKKRISKMLSNLKRRREERMTTYKLLSGNTKNMFSSLSGVNERQTASGSCEDKKNNNSMQPLMSDANTDCVFDSSNEFKLRRVQEKDTVTVSIDGGSKSFLHQVSSIGNKSSSASKQGQLLSSELLHFLTQNTTVTPAMSSTGGERLISRKQELPAGYSDFSENTLALESDYSMDITAVLGSPDKKNLEASSAMLPSLSDRTVDLDRLSTVDIEQPEILKIQSLNTSSCLQEDLVSSTGSTVQCKGVLKNSEIFPTLSFDQPFLSENTLGEILQQASSDFQCNFEEEADHSSVCMDTSLSDFSSLDNVHFAGKCQIDHAHSVCQQYNKLEQTYQHPETSNGSQSQVLQHFSSEESQQFLVPSTESFTLDSLMGLNGFIPVPENAKSSTHIYPANAITGSAHPNLSTSQIASLSVSPQYFSHTVATAAAGDVTEHENSCCENLPPQMQEMLPTLPSYREATLALAEQLGLSQSINQLL